MTIKRTAYTFCLVSALLVGSAFSQVATGTLPFNSFGGGPFDVVNLGNLNVHFSIPIVQKAGRGMPFTYSLGYDSSVWTPVGSSGHQTWVPTSTWGWSATNLANSTPYIGYNQNIGAVTQCGYMGTGSFYVISYGGFTYHDQFGLSHLTSGGGAYIVNVQGASGCPNGGPQPSTPSTYVAQDGSGYIFTLGVPTQSSMSASVAYRNGQTINAPQLTAPPSQPSNYSITDANGNTISFDSSTGKYTDTLGQNVLTVAGTNPVTFTYMPPSQTAVHYSVNYSTFNIKTNFDCSGIAPYTASNVLLVSSISLPDGTSYSFSYEPTQGQSGYYTGRLKSVTLPTGGSITYAYPLSSDGTKNEINCADGSAPLPVGSTPSMTRTLSSPGGQWNYARAQTSGNHWQTTVTSPTGDNTVLDFQVDSTTGNGATYSFYETQRQTNQLINGTQTPLLTTVTCWNGNSSCTTTAVSSPISSRTVTLQYPNGGLQSKTQTLYNAYGLVTEIDKYAYGTGGPGAIQGATTISYASLGNIYDHPAAVTVTDGTVLGHVFSRTAYTYDEYSSYPLQQTIGTLQHNSVSGSRGNATTVSNANTWNPSNGTGTYLTSHFKYFDTGNVYQSQNVNGQWTTYNYPDATSTCSNSFATGFTLPISGLSSLASTTWDCIGGVATAAADLNGNSSSSSYTDPYFWRPASATDPTTASTSFTYTPYNSTTQAPANVDSRMVFNGTSSVSEQLTTVGGFGQVLYSQQREGPSSNNYDSTQVLYDSFLRANQSTMPCVTSAGQGCPSAAITKSDFDALGRVIKTTDGGGGWVKFTYTQNDVLQELGPAPAGENTKQKQLEYDALGRLTSVCEKTNLNGSGVCSQQTSSPNGYLTTYTYGTTTINSLLYRTMTVTQNAQASSGQQTRTYTYDTLGRLISEQNPENGTTSYTYDSDSAGMCSGTSNGDLVKLTDAKGNKICYQYDALHRVTSITYPSGPDSANTPTKTMVYDSATYNSTAMLNPKGRLVEAYTGASGSKTTDEFFSYSVRGELTDTWECTPHSGTNGCASVSNYYHVTAAFWANGALNTLSSNISGLPSQTYVVDGMGRTNGVNASAGQIHLVDSTGTSYDLANYKTTVKYGSGDSDVVNLDPNTGRMTMYTFNVGTKSDVGQTTWNTNGSLATLRITDTITSTVDTQTCSYIHDDLSRISSVNCLNGSTNTWNQAFSYDAFGNITKTSNGPGIAFGPTYDTSKNWITSLPGPITTTTDSNGQMTYDGVHNYTWDAEHKMHSVDANPTSCSTSGECLTYDALGRMVEKTSGSTYTQIVYGPQGRFATMNGQTLVKAFIPLPGAQAVYTAASLNTTNKIAYYRHTDHLGSSRLATTPTQTLYSSTAYAPDGEPYSQAGATDLSFTGQDQDAVSGMHDFLMRKYVPVQGRWLLPDPAGLGAVDPRNPQSWNRYAYVQNNPMSLVDPFGLDDCGYGGNFQNVPGCTPPQPPPGPIVSPPCSTGGVSTSPCDPSMPQPGCPAGVVACGGSGGSGSGGGTPDLSKVYKGSMIQIALTNQDCNAYFGGPAKTLLLILEADIFDPTAKPSSSQTLGEQSVATDMGSEGQIEALEGGNVIGVNYNSFSQTFSFSSQLGLMFHELDHNQLPSGSPIPHDPNRYLAIEDKCSHAGEIPLQDPVPVP